MTYSSSARQKGISLLELMVALAIGLVLLLALAFLMLTANRSSLQRSTSEMLDETARQVFSKMENDLRRAGYVDQFKDQQTMLQAFNLSDVAILARYVRQSSNMSTNTAGIIDDARSTLLAQLTDGRVRPLIGCVSDFTGNPGNSITCAAPAHNNRRQSIQVAYQAVKNAGSNVNSGVSTVVQENNSESGAGLSCNAQHISEDAPIVVNRYYLNNVTSAGETYLSLYCDNSTTSFTGNPPIINNDSSQPLVLGIEEMVFRYLMTPADATASDQVPEFNETDSGRSVTEYLSADAVSNADLGWAGVVGVEVCLIVAAEPLDGGREVDIPAIQQTVPGCLRANTLDTTADAAFEPDRARPGNAGTRVYRRYVRTISLPNSIFLTPINLQ